LIEELNQQQQIRAPAPSRIWGATPHVLEAIEKIGSAYRVEIFSEVGGESEQNSEAIRRLVRYGLVAKDEENRFLLTKSGIEYCKILPGRKKNRLEEPQRVENEGRTGLPALPEERTAKAAPPAVTTTTKEVLPTLVQPRQIQAQNELKTNSTNTNRSQIDQTFRNRPELTDLDRQFLDGFEHHPPLQQPMARDRGRSGRRNRPFLGFSEKETDTVLPTLGMWRKEANPSEDEKLIVDKIFFSHCMDAQHPSNYKRVKDRKSAADYFHLSLDVFNDAIGKLIDNGIAYYFDGYHNKKVGIYVDWLDLLKSGRF